MNIILVTGASAGMGMEFVKQIDKKFPNVDEFWLIARRKDKLQALANSCNHKCRVVDLDLTDEDSFEILDCLLKQENAKIRLLINNAGFGIIGKYTELSRSELTGMVRVNAEALTAVNSVCIPYMMKNSRIILMASSAAFMPQPSFAVYAATKSFVLSLAYALNAELKKDKIYVTAVCPGPVNTEFFDIAEKHGKILPIKKFFMAKPENVVKKALVDARNKKSVSVYGFASNCMRVWGKIFPHKLVSQIIMMMYK